MRQVAIILVTGILTSVSAPVFAAKPTKEAALYLQLEQTVKKYQLAQTQYASGDSNKVLQMNSALEDLEDIANRCFAIKTCARSKVISAYEQLIKRNDFSDIATINPIETVQFAIPEMDATIKLLNKGNLELFIKYNEPVQAALTTWLTSQRAFLMNTWENYQYMRYLMAPEYDVAGLPEAILFGMLAKESGGRVHSVSKTGAQGPLQFMPSTAQRFGLGKGEGFDMRNDPQFAARANAAYMKERFEELNNSVEMAIAGYNGGEGRARRIFNSNPGASFWDERIYKQWPEETRDYVPAVLAAAWLFMHSKEYGLDFPKVDASPAQLIVQNSTTINELSICLGNQNNAVGWYRVLRNLNPHFEPTQFIASGTSLRAPKKLIDSYQKHCVSGAKLALAKQLTQARKQPVFSSPPVEIQNALETNDANPILLVGTPNPNLPTSILHNKYVVKAGETLMSITRAFDCDLRRLIKENNISGPDYIIEPGQELKLPGCKKSP